MPHDRLSRQQPARSLHPAMSFWTRRIGCGEQMTALWTQIDRTAMKKMREIIFAPPARTRRCRKASRGAARRITYLEDESRTFHPATGRRLWRFPRLRETKKPLENHGQGEDRAAHGRADGQGLPAPAAFLDLTRKYYLFGRGSPGAEVNARPGERVIESAAAPRAISFESPRSTGTKLFRSRCIRRNAAHRT